MGTHPIFESDFDCLTEWRCNMSIQKRELSLEDIQFLATDQPNFTSTLSQMQSRESSLSHATRAMWRFRQRRICRNILSTLKCRKRRRLERITWKAVGHVT